MTETIRDNARVSLRQLRSQLPMDRTLAITMKHTLVPFLGAMVVMYRKPRRTQLRGLMEAGFRIWGYIILEDHPRGELSKASPHVSTASSSCLGLVLDLECQTRMHHIYRRSTTLHLLRLQTLLADYLHRSKEGPRFLPVLVWARFH